MTTYVFQEHTGWDSCGCDCCDAIQYSFYNYVGLRVNREIDTRQMPHSFCGSFTDYHDIQVSLLAYHNIQIDQQEWDDWQETMDKLDRLCAEHGIDIEILPEL